MAVRILEYQAAIAKEHISQGKGKVPVIISYVMYHGKNEWTSPKSVAELYQDFDLHVKLAQKAPFLIDLGEKKTEELIVQGAAAAPQIILQKQGSEELTKALPLLWPMLKKHQLVDDENLQYLIDYT